MATSNDTGDIQDATPTAGFVKLSLTSQKPANSVDARFAQAFNEERFCDMTIKTRDGTIPVHKAVICLQSPVIAKAMDGQFLEAQQNCFDLSHESTESVSRFVQYCYLSRYDTLERARNGGSALALTKDEDGIVRYIGNTAVQCSNLMIHGQNRSLPRNGSRLLSVGWGNDAQELAKNSAYTLNAKRLELDINMWTMGDVYDVEHLKSYAVSQLETRLSALSKHSCSPSLILDIIHPIYGCTATKNDDLRKMLIRWLTSFKRAIGVDPIQKAHFHMLVRDIDDLMTDLVDGWLHAP